MHLKNELDVALCDWELPAGRWGGSFLARLRNRLRLLLDLLHVLLEEPPDPPEIANFTPAACSFAGRLYTAS